jgi:hypothetical protein
MNGSSASFFLETDMKLFTFDKLIAITAFIIASAAAFFSVTGIGNLFAGAFISAVVMASALELGKLVAVSFLYRYWETIPKFLKRYLLVSSVILMIITSLGIYGYLSSAYAKVAADPLTKNGQVAALIVQDSTLSQDIQYRRNRLDQLMSLRTQQETRLDSAIAKTTTGNSRTVTGIQQSLRNNDMEMRSLRTELSNLNRQKDSLTRQRIELETNIKTNSDIGTFIYIADVLGMKLDDVVKWFIFIIVFVFDPLSICLVLAYNFLQKQKNVQQIQKYDFVKELEKSTPQVLIRNEDKEPVKSEISELPTQELELPYYKKPGFNWETDDSWKNDKEAVNYYNYIRTFGNPVA